MFPVTLPESLRGLKEVVETLALLEGSIMFIVGTILLVLAVISSDEDTPRAMRVKNARVGLTCLLAIVVLWAFYSWINLVVILTLLAFALWFAKSTAHLVLGG